MARTSNIQAQAKSGKLDEKVYHNLLNQVGSTNKDLKETVQQCAMQAMLWAFVHSDYDKASKLALVVKNEMSQNQFSQLRKWFEAFGPFGWRRTDDENYAATGGFKFRKSNAKDAKAFDLDGADKTPWYEMAKEETTEEGEEKAPIAPSAFLKRIDKLMKDIDKAVKDHTLENPKVNEPEMVNFLKELDKVAKKYQFLRADNENKKAKEPVSNHIRKHREPAKGIHGAISV